MKKIDKIRKSNKYWFNYYNIKYYTNYFIIGGSTETDWCSFNRFLKNLIKYELIKRKIN